MMFRSGLAAIDYLRINSLFRHAGPEEPAPYLIRGHPEILEKTGCARLLRSLRLPSVTRLEFTPMKIGAGMTTRLKAVRL
jgi:hypothetical protein